MFALGVVSFEMIALRRLFQRKTDYLTFRAVMEQPIPDVRRYRADVPEALAAVLSRALDRDPNNRFESARQFGTAILDALAKSDGSVRNAAKLLGLGQATVYRKIKRYAVDTAASV